MPETNETEMYVVITSEVVEYAIFFNIPAKSVLLFFLSIKVYAMKVPRYSLNTE